MALSGSGRPAAGTWAPDSGTAPKTAAMLGSLMVHMPDAGADDGRGRGDVPLEESGGTVRGPAAALGEPAGHGEVVQGDHGAQAAFEGALDHPPVVRERCAGELSLGGLDAGPFDTEAVVGEAESGEQIHVLAPPVVAVGSVTAGLGDAHGGGTTALFELPPVAVGVVALDLMGGGGGSPQEAVGEGKSVGGGIMDGPFRRCAGREGRQVTSSLTACGCGQASAW